MHVSTCFPIVSNFIFYAVRQQLADFQTSLAQHVKDHEVHMAVHGSLSQSSKRCYFILPHSQAFPDSSLWSLTVTKTGAEEGLWMRLISQCTCVSIWPVSYTKICGRNIGYQIGLNDAFCPFQQSCIYHGRLPTSPRVYTIDDVYVDGLNLTHGNPREHIWTFVIAINDADGQQYPKYLCLCTWTGSSGIAEHYCR